MPKWPRYRVNRIRSRPLGFEPVAFWAGEIPIPVATAPEPLVAKIIACPTGTGLIDCGDRFSWQSVGSLPDKHAELAGLAVGVVLANLEHEYVHPSYPRPSRSPPVVHPTGRHGPPSVGS